MLQLKQHYDGYHFSINSEDIFNPYSAADVKGGDDLLFDDGELDMKIIDNQGPIDVYKRQEQEIDVFGSTRDGAAFGKRSEKGVYHRGFVQGEGPIFGEPFACCLLYTSF